MDITQNPLVREIIDLALREDIGRGDLTTLGTVPETAQAEGEVIAKEDGIIAGIPVFAAVYSILSPKVTVRPLVEEGHPATRGTKLAVLQGPARPLLTGERTALNFLQRLSGIATETRRLKELISVPNCFLTDTRKTSPGMRVLEKYAVRVGGGVNHRLGLDDAVLIKDNHIAVAGSITNAVRQVRKTVPFPTRIEVEAKTEEEVREALEAGVDIIMLDNMNPQQLTRMVELIGGRAQVEASGNITADNIEAVARTGVNYISVGALTHSARALDISLYVWPKTPGSS